MNVRLFSRAHGRNFNSFRVYSHAAVIKRRLRDQSVTKRLVDIDFRLLLYERVFNDVYLNVYNLYILMQIIKVTERTFFFRKNRYHLKFE